MNNLMKRLMILIIYLNMIIQIQKSNLRNKLERDLEKMIIICRKDKEEIDYNFI
jgi:hypothetical protein